MPLLQPLVANPLLSAPNYAAEPTEFQPAPQNAASDFFRGLRSSLAGASANSAAVDYYQAQKRGDAEAARRHGLRAQQLLEEAASNAPSVQSLGDINDIGSGVRYAAGQFGSLPVGLASPMAASIAGAALGSRFGLRGSGMAAIGGALGATGAMSHDLRNAAAMQHFQANDQQDPNEILNQSAVQGVAQAAPFIAGPVAGLPGRLMGKAMLPAARSMGAAITREAALNAGLGAASEGIGQHFEGQWNPNRDKSHDEMRLWDSAAGNALASVPFAIPGHLADRVHQGGALAGDALKKYLPAALSKGAELAGEGVDAVRGAYDARPQSLDEAALAVGQGAAKVHKAAEDVATRLLNKDPDVATLLRPQNGLDVEGLQKDDAEKHAAAGKLLEQIAADPGKFPDGLRKAAEDYANSSRSKDSWVPFKDAVNDWKRGSTVDTGLKEFADEMAIKLGKGTVAAQKFVDDVKNVYKVERDEQGRSNAQTPDVPSRHDDEFDSLHTDAIVPLMGIKDETANVARSRAVARMFRAWGEADYGMGKNGEVPYVPFQALTKMFDANPEGLLPALKQSHDLMKAQGLLKPEAEAGYKQVVGHIETNQGVEGQMSKLVEKNLLPTSKVSNIKAGDDYVATGRMLTDIIRRGEFTDGEEAWLDKQFGHNKDNVVEAADKLLPKDKLIAALEDEDALNPNEVGESTKWHGYKGDEPYKAGEMRFTKPNEEGEMEYLGTHDQHADNKAEQLTAKNKTTVKRVGYADYIREKHADNPDALIDAMIEATQRFGVNDRELNKTHFMLKEEAAKDKGEAHDIHPDEFKTLQPGSAYNKWAESTKNGGLASEGKIWFERADGTKFATSAARIIRRMREAGNESRTSHGETDKRGLDKQHEQLMQGITSMLASGHYEGDKFVPALKGHIGFRTDVKQPIKWGAKNIPDELRMWGKPDDTFGKAKVEKRAAQMRETMERIDSEIQYVKNALADNSLSDRARGALESKLHWLELAKNSDGEAREAFFQRIEYKREERALRDEEGGAPQKAKLSDLELTSEERADQAAYIADALKKQSERVDATHVGKGSKPAGSTERRTTTRINAAGKEEQVGIKNAGDMRRSKWPARTVEPELETEEMHSAESARTHDEMTGEELHPRTTEVTAHEYTAEGKKVSVKTEVRPGMEVKGLTTPEDIKKSQYVLGILRKGIPAFNDMLKRASDAQKADIVYHLGQLAEVGKDNPIWGGNPPKDMDAFQARVQKALASVFPGKPKAEIKENPVRFGAKGAKEEGKVVQKDRSANSPPALDRWRKENFDFNTKEEVDQFLKDLHAELPKAAERLRAAEKAVDAAIERKASDAEVSALEDKAEELWSEHRDLQDMFANGGVAHDLASYYDGVKGAGGVTHDDVVKMLGLKEKGKVAGIHESRVESIADRLLGRPVDRHTHSLATAAYTLMRQGADEGKSMSEIMADPGVRRFINSLKGLAERGDKRAEEALTMVRGSAIGLFAIQHPKLDEAVASAVYERGATLGSVLAKFKDHKMPSVLQAVAKAVSKVVGDVKINLEDLDKSTGGHYSVRDHEITINGARASDRGIAHTVLHEGVHAATLKAMAERPELHRAAYALLAHVADKAPRLAEAYGLTDVAEFVAEGLSNLRFQSALKNIEANKTVSRYLGGRIANAWHAFTSLIHKALGLESGSENALSQLLELSGHMMKHTAEFADKSSAYTEESLLNRVIPKAAFQKMVDQIVSHPALTPEARAYAKQELFVDENQPHISGVVLAITKRLLDINTGVTAEGFETLLAKGHSIAKDALQDTASPDSDRLFADKSERHNAQGTFPAERTPPSKEEIEAFHEDIRRRFKGAVASGLHEVLMGKNAKGKDIYLSGKWVEGAVHASLYAKNIGQVGAHESFHQFFANLKKTPEAAKVVGILEKAANSAPVLRQIERLLDGEREALAQIKQGAKNYMEERMAYMFQFHQAGLLKIGPETQTVFQKIADFFRKIAGVLNNDQKADAILRAFDKGRMPDGDAAARVLANNIEARENLYKAVGDAFRPATDAMSRLVNTSEMNLKRHGVEQYNEVLRLFKRSAGEHGAQGYLDAKDHKMKLHMNAAYKTIEGLQPKDLEVLAKYLHTGKQPKDAVLKGAYDRIVGKGGLMETMENYLREAGVKRWDDQANDGNGGWVPMGHIDRYYPRSLDTTMLVKDPAAFVADLLKYNGAELEGIAKGYNESARKVGATEDKFTAQNVAEALENRMIQGFGQKDVQETVSKVGMSPFMQAINKRELHWLAPEILEKYGEKDVAKTLTSYVAQAVKRAEYVRRFGLEGEKLQDLLENGYKANKAKLLAELGPNATKEQIDKVESRALKVAQGAARDVMALEGTLGHDISNGLRKFNNSVMVYENMRLLSTSLFSQFIDPMGVVVRGGTMGDAWDTFKRGLKEVVSSIKDDTHIKDKWGNIADEVGTTDAGSALAAFGQVYSSQYMGKLFRGMNDALFKYNGMEGFNRGMQVGATKAAINFIKRHVQNPNERSAEYLRELGLDPKQVKIDKDGHLDYTDPKIKEALHQWVNGSIMRPNSAQRPAWASDPHYMIFWHMKQFAYTFHDVIMKRAMHEYKTFGDMGPAGVLIAAYTPIMIASDAMKSVLLTGGEPTWMKAGLGSELEHGAMRAGLLGRYQPAGDIALTPGRSMLGIGGPLLEQLGQIADQSPGEALRNAMPGANLLNMWSGKNHIEVQGED